MDSDQAPRPKRNAPVPERAQEYVNQALKSRAKQLSASQPTPRTSDEPFEPFESASQGRSKRKITVPKRAEQAVKERESLVEAHAQRVAAKKRKAEAEARGNASQPEPLTDVERDGKRQKQVTFDSILERPLDDVSDIGERMDWLTAAIHHRDRRDFSETLISLEELEAIWDDPEAGESDGNDSGAVGQHAMDSSAQRVQIEVGHQEHVMLPKRLETPNPLRKPLSRLDSTSHTTTSRGTPTSSKQDYSPNGRALPVSNTPPDFQPLPKPLPRLGPTDHTTLAHGVLTNPKYDRGPDGKQLSEPVAFVPRSTYKGKGKLVRSPTPDAPPSTGDAEEEDGKDLPSDTTEPEDAEMPTEPHILERETDTSDDDLGWGRTPTAGLTSPDPQFDHGSNSSPRGSHAGSQGPSGDRQQGHSYKSHGSKSKSKGQSLPYVPRSKSIPPPGPKPSRHRAMHPSKPQSSRRRQPPQPPQPARKPQQEPRGSTPADRRRSHRPPAAGEHGSEPPTEREQESDQLTEREDEEPSVLVSTVRQEAQMRYFGAAKPYVKMLAERVRLLAVVENPYADIMIRYSKPDADGHRAALGTVAEKWLPREWAKIQREKRPGKPPLELLDSYIHFVMGEFTKCRIGTKAGLQSHISPDYLLYRHSPTNSARVKQLLPDAFLSRNLIEGDPLAFRHPIFKTAIQECFFGNPSTRKGIAFDHPDKFCPIPFAVLALVATITNALIAEYAKGAYRSLHLNAEQQVSWFKTYYNLLVEMDRENPLKLRNFRARLFDECHGSAPVQEIPLIELPNRVYGPDSEDEYQSRVMKPAAAQRQLTKAGPSGTRHSSEAEEAAEAEEAPAHARTMVSMGGSSTSKQPFAGGEE